MFKKAVSSLLATFAAADINADYSEYLNGEIPLLDENLEPLWAQFKEEFGASSPVDLSAESAKSTFLKNLDAVIAHNSQTEKSYKRALNKFSAMTFEQFSEHFHLADSQKYAE